MSPISSKLLLFFVIPIVFLAKENTKRHPFHVSTTEIAHNIKNKSLEITCRIFTDDFENALSKRFKTKTDLYAKNKEKEMSALIKSYLEANLKFAIDGKVAKYNYLGFENDHEATNIYLEITNVANFKKLNANNNLLYDLFDDQMNILHVEKGGQRKSTKASFPERQLRVSF